MGLEAPTALRDSSEPRVMRRKSKSKSKMKSNLDGPRFTAAIYRAVQATPHPAHATGPSQQMWGTTDTQPSLIIVMMVWGWTIRILFISS